MSRRASASRLVLGLAPAGLAITGLAARVNAEAPPNVTEVSRCATLEPAADRLACYDSLVCGAIAAPDHRLACYDAVAKGKAPVSAPAPETSAAVGSSESAKGGDAAFGVVKQKPSAKPHGPDQITAVVTELTADQLGNVSMSLDNGQSWTFHDPEPRVRSGDTVTIRRAALGSFLMTTPSRHSYRVQRTR